MRKWSLTLVCVTGLLLFVSLPARSQQSSVTEREAEWNQYVLPQSTFVRLTDPAKSILFQIPAEWKQPQPDKLTFVGPHGANISVIIEKIPDGVPLREIVSAMLQQLRDIPNVADSMVVRRTTMSATEAREILFEIVADNDEVSRRIIWSTVSGPHAVSMVLIVPVANLAEVEPYFKAVVQSVTFLDYNYVAFDALRSTLTKDAKPTRVDEVQSLANSLSALDGSGRQSTVSKLATIFSSAPDTAIDLVLDGRPMVRAGVFEAIAQSRNNSLQKFLLRALNDREPLVAEKAARSIAADPGVVALLRDDSREWSKIEPLARVWPFLSQNNQIKILDEIFAQPLLPSPKAGTTAGKSSVTATAIVLPPGSTAPPAVVTKLSATSDPIRQFNALTLMRHLPASDYKLPLSSLLTAKNDELIILALQIGWWRHELLPAPELLKLLSSSSSEVRRLAALNLGQSGSVSDIKSIETNLSKPANPARPTLPGVEEPRKPTDAGRSLDDNNLQLTMSKIRLREQLAAATGEARRQLIKKGLSDPKLVEWVWYRFVRDGADREGPEVEPKSPSISPVKILPLGENLFPQDVTYYAALPQPQIALDKLASALNGLQLESARSQANLVLILSVLREQLAQQLDSSPSASPLDYSGINTKEPIALASWYTEGAPLGIQSAERKAIIFRVSDRARFERSLTLYQRGIGDFDKLTNYFSGGVRFLTFLPAVLPLSAKAVLDAPLKDAKETPLLKYGLVGGTQWNGYSIKVVEQRRVETSGHMIRDAAYLTYFGDTAVLAPDLESLRDVLTRLSSAQDTLATNTNFKRLIEASGDNSGEAIYLSNVTQLFAEPTDNLNSSSTSVVTESGALKISNSTWENSYQLHFRQSGWLKPFMGFQPEALTSPRELLPRTTIAYYFMNIDAVAGWRDWSQQLFGAERRKEMTAIWALDFEKEVLPELGPECGVAVLGMPNNLEKFDVPVAGFFKLKSEKLARALESGKLLTDSVAGTATTPTHVKLGTADLFVTVKNGFLVLANSQLAITALQGKEKLIAARDFSRAAKQAPAGVVMFGGYNLDAAISAIGDSGTDSDKTQKLSLISSWTKVFHSPNFYATATADAVQGRSSVSMDREGRFSVSELSSLSKDYRLTYAQVDARGVPLQNQERLSSLKLKIRAKAAGEIDRIKEDVSTTYQVAEKLSDTELELRIAPRNSEPKSTLMLPITASEFTPYLQPSGQIRSDDKAVLEKAREIAGEERDAWKVARKLADWTFNNIKWKRVDEATAPQTLATLEADCLEFGELYVAMARSLGLPARMVSGLAYSGASFGGHAWVEVYVGEWIEVDPTWGTSFVDATHIRNSANAVLLTYASLNLVEFEVLEAPRAIAEFQKDPRTLAEKLCQELPKGNLTALSSALDLAVLMEGRVGLGTWESLTNSERESMYSGYRRVLVEVSSAFRKAEGEATDLRLLKVNESGDKADAFVMEPDSEAVLLKFTFVKRNGAWFLSEALQVDTDLHIVSETLHPTIRTIVDRRTNKSARVQSSSDFLRIMFALGREMTSVVIADQALKNDPKNQGLRHLKAFALVRNDREEDAIKVWQELANEEPPFAPALLSLAHQYETGEDPARKKLAIEFYTRYGVVVPEDPRTHTALAVLYEESGDDARAEAEHRAALKADPGNSKQSIDFAAFLALRRRLKEAALVIDEADKKAGPAEDLFGDLIMALYFTEDKTIAEEFARSQPQRMAKSALANLYFGYQLLDNGKSLQSIASLKKAAALQNDWAAPYAAMARSYRKLRNWTAALTAADAAIKFGAGFSDGYFHRACALARLGRIDEALEALAKAVEIDPELSEVIGQEADLKALASKPAFKKLLPTTKPKQ